VVDTELGGRDARQVLWERYDAGDLSTEELDARLRAVDRAGDDPKKLASAVDGQVRLRRSNRRLGRALVAVGAALLLVVAAVAIADLAGDGGSDSSDPGVVVIEPGGAVGGVGGVVVEPPPDCPELDEALERFEDLDEESAPANPALLSDPAFVPEGYLLGDEEPIVPGADTEIAMSVSAGNPPPIDILARTLDGPMPVSMRTWVYDSADAASEAGMSVLGQGVCTYDMAAFEVPDRPEIGGSVVTGVIPTTAFASWRLGERRFTVAVEAGTDADAEATAAAQQLAGEIAAREYDAASTAPEPG
jgi:hypothetical protein